MGVKVRLDNTCWLLMEVQVQVGNASPSEEETLMKRERTQIHSTEP